MKRFITITVFILLVFSSTSFARYRAFKLEIEDVSSGETYEVITSLSPETYISYYEFNRAFRKVRVKNTWMCWGNTSYFKKICPDPRVEQPN